ncbi:MAG: hypothetical protein RL215_1192 [Planctomycetota bacterium]|jgi:hypothetical protein
MALAVNNDTTNVFLEHSIPARACLDSILHELFLLFLAPYHLSLLPDKN